jgi:hypothetical protein
MANVCNVTTDTTGIIFHYDDGTTSCISGIKGDSITGIVRVSGETPAIGTVDTYRINLTSGNNACFTVHNGLDVKMSCIVDNNDGTYTWNFSEGTSYTTSNLCGDKGDSICGIVPTSFGVESNVYSLCTTSNCLLPFTVCNGRHVCLVDSTENPDYSYTWHFSDGCTFKTNSLRGATGRGVSCLAPVSISTAEGGTSIYRTCYTDGTTSDDICVTNGNGIASVLRTGGTGCLGSLDTYTITMGDGQTSTFNVQNGTGISCIVPATSGVPVGVDRYNICLHNGGVTSFDIAQGAGITCIQQICSGIGGSFDKYRINFSRNCPSFDFNIYRPLDGGKVQCVSVLSSSQNGTCYKMTFDNGYAHCYEVFNGVNGASVNNITQTCRCLDTFGNKVDDVKFFLTNGSVFTTTLCHGKGICMLSTDACTDGRYKWNFSDGSSYTTGDLRGIGIAQACYNSTYLGKPKLSADSCDIYSVLLSTGVTAGQFCVHNGKSAFQYATDGGFVGTETDFTNGIAAMVNVDSYITCTEGLLQTASSEFSCVNTVYNSLVDVYIPEITNSIACVNTIKNATIGYRDCAAWYASGVGTDTCGYYSAKCYYDLSRSICSNMVTAANDKILCVTGIVTTIDNCMAAACTTLDNVTINKCLEIDAFTETECSCIQAFVNTLIDDYTNGAGTACLWAETPYNQIICNDGVNDRYSALHWATVSQSYGTNALNAADCITTMCNDITTMSCAVGNAATSIATTCAYITTARDCVQSLQSCVISSKSCIDNINSCLTSLVQNTEVDISNAIAAGVAAVDAASSLEVQVAAINGCTTCLSNLVSCVIGVCNTLKTGMYNSCITSCNNVITLCDGINNTSSSVDVCSYNTLNDLTDVVVTGVCNDDTLMWDSTVNKWCSKRIEIDWCNTGTNNSPIILNKPTIYEPVTEVFSNVNVVNVVHNRGRIPTVSVYTTGGVQMFTSTIQLDLNRFVVEFSNYESGYIVYQ